MQTHYNKEKRGLDQLIMEHQSKSTRLLEKLRRDLPSLKRAAEKQTDELELCRRWHVFEMTLRGPTKQELVVGLHRDERITLSMAAACAPGFEIETTDDAHRLRVTSVQSNSPGSIAGLRAGDILLKASRREVNGLAGSFGKPARSLSLLDDTAALLISPDTLLLHFIRHGGLALGEQWQIDLLDFGAAFSAHCAAHGAAIPEAFSSRGLECYGRKAVLDRGYYLSLFEKLGLRVVTVRRLITDEETRDIFESVERGLREFDSQREQARILLQSKLDKLHHGYRKAEAEYEALAERYSISLEHCPCCGRPHESAVQEDNSEEACVRDMSLEGWAVYWPASGWHSFESSLKFFEAYKDDRLDGYQVLNFKQIETTFTAALQDAASFDDAAKLKISSILAASVGVEPDAVSLTIEHLGDPVTSARIHSKITFPDNPTANAALSKLKSRSHEGIFASAGALQSALARSSAMIPVTHIDEPALRGISTDFRTLPKLRKRLEWERDQNALRNAQREMYEIDDKRADAESELDAHLHATPEARARKEHLLEEARDRKLEMLERARKEYTLRVIGIGDVRRSQEGRLEEDEPPVAPGCVGWCSQLELQLERPPPLARAIWLHSYGCCTSLLACCEDASATISVLDAVFADLLVLAAGGTDHAGVATAAAGIDVAQLVRLMGLLSAASRLRWIMGRPMLEDLARCFHADDGALGTQLLSELSVQDGSLPRALDRLGFKGKLATIYEQCRQRQQAEPGMRTGRVSIAQAKHAAPAPWRSQPQQWIELINALSGIASVAPDQPQREAVPAVRTTFHLTRLVAAIQEVCVPSCPLLMVLFGIGAGVARDGLLDAFREALQALSTPDALASDPALPEEVTSQAGLSPMHLVAALGDRALTEALATALPSSHSRLATLFTKSTPLSISCVNGFGALACLGQPTPQLNVALLHAAEHFQLDACRQLLERGASAGVRDASGRSALDHLVRLGCARLAGGAVWSTQHSEQVWRETIDDLVSHGADPFAAPAAGVVVPVLALLAYCAWARWPPNVRDLFSQTLSSDADADSPVLAHVWRNAGVHAFALAPSKETNRLATMLLALGGCARAALPGSQQTALHILAAGGTYVWTDHSGLAFSTDASEVVAGHDERRLDAMLELAQLVTSYGAEWRARDNGSNTAAHVACAAGHVRMVAYLYSCGSKFERPWFNQRGKTPSQLAADGGTVLRCLQECENRAQRERRQREQEAEKLHGASSITEIDPATGKALLESGTPSEVLLGQRDGSTPSGAMITPAADAASSDPASADAASTAAAMGLVAEGAQGVRTSAGEEANSTGDATRTERQKLLASLSFAGQPFQVNLTRHALEQLRLLHQADAGRCHNALRLLHRLAAGSDAPEQCEVLLERAHPGPLCCSESRASRDKVYLVFERSGTGFFECRQPAVRVWSIETTRDKLHACVAFVTTAWELGAMALSSAEAEADGTLERTTPQLYAMGTTATLDRPAENWHPIHAEGADAELPVPFILKWFPLNGIVARYFLLVAHEQAAAAEVHVPMLLDEREKGIANPTTPLSATLIIGRSGTGKTSIALQILFELQCANTLRAGGAVADGLRLLGGLAVGEAGNDAGALPAHSNVIFMTKSLTLTRSLQRQFAAMLQTLGLPIIPTATLIENFAAGRDLPQPLFLCSSEWLTMLDRQLSPADRFFRDEREARDFIGELSGDTDSLGQLLRDDQPTEGSAPAAHANSSGRQLLTFERFARWAKVDGWLSTSKLSASSVYREISSYIKGSAEAMEARHGYLSRQEYLDLPAKMTTVAPEQRAAIYSVFERYMRKAKAQLTYDAADVVRHLRRKIGSIAGQYTRLDRVLLDEVQDQTQAEIELMLHAAADPRGFVIFGDTAQTISRGVGFRFADVKQLFWRADVPGGGGRCEPALHELATNYRTHQGIIGCSASLVALIQKLYPNSIDALAEPERGHFPGPLPALLPEVDAASLVESMLAADEVGVTEMGANQAVRALHAANSARSHAHLHPCTCTCVRAISNHAAFSASPRCCLMRLRVCVCASLSLSLCVSVCLCVCVSVCLCACAPLYQVLVRSEASKATLPPELRAGLVLTIEEAKGLEFDDVCVYEFFSGSPADKEWHVLYTQLPEAVRETAAASLRPTAVEFDPQLHLVLCEELKYLYVALTRARKRVFLFDSSLERRAPVFDFLAALGVAEEGLERQLSATTSKRSKNSVADWRLRAENFEQNKLWRPAEQCYLKAGCVALALHAGGHRLVAEAKDAEGPSAKAMKLLNAATAFLQSATRSSSDSRTTQRGFCKAAFFFYLSAKQGAGNQLGLESRCFFDAGNVLAKGLGRGREAAACYFVAANLAGGSGGGSNRRHFALAAEALADHRCEDFAERAAATAALRQLATGGSTADHPELNEWLRVSELEVWLRDAFMDVA